MNPTVKKIVEERIKTLDPNFPTVWENTNYNPLAGTPHQEVSFLPADPDDQTMGSTMYQERAFCQIMLKYPIGGGSGDIDQKAKYWRDAFPRGLSMTDGTTTVYVTSTPKEIGGMRINGWYCVPVSVLVHAYIRRY